MIYIQIKLEVGTLRLNLEKTTRANELTITGMGFLNDNRIEKRNTIPFQLEIIPQELNTDLSIY